MKAIWVAAEVQAGGDYPHSSYALTALTEAPHGQGKSP
jgi:hypothetical protein